MATERPQIIPPRVPLVDPRTGTIAREWFHWLLKVVGRTDDEAILAAFDSTAATGEVSKAVQDARILEAFPAHIDAELIKRVADGEVLRATVSAAAEGELRKAIADLRLLIATATGQKRHSAARDMARVMLRC